MTATITLTIPPTTITVALDGEGGGTITSDLDTDRDNAIWTAAVDTLESLVLAHACAGVNIASDAYTSGLSSAIEAISNNIL